MKPPINREDKELLKIISGCSKHGRHATSRKIRDALLDNRTGEVDEKVANRLKRQVNKQLKRLTSLKLVSRSLGTYKLTSEGSGKLA